MSFANFIMQESWTDRLGQAEEHGTCIAARFQMGRVDGECKQKREANNEKKEKTMEKKRSRKWK